jgi:hypothetical protein
MENNPENFTQEYLGFSGRPGRRGNDKKLPMRNRR